MLTLIKWILRPWEVDVGKPTAFQESRKDLIERLRSEDPDEARELVEEARRLTDAVDALCENVERRATTLQGVVSIAATFAIAAGALLLDPSKVEGQGWRLGLIALFGALVYCLIATAFRATQASTQIHQWTRADPTDNLKRPQLSRSDFELEQAVDMFRSYGRNTKVVDWKVAYMQAATEWFQRALVVLGLIAAAFGSYAFFHDSGSEQRSSVIRFELKSPLFTPSPRQPTTSGAQGEAENQDGHGRATTGSAP